MSLYEERKIARKLKQIREKIKAGRNLTDDEGLLYRLAQIKKWG